LIVRGGEGLRKRAPSGVPAGKDPSTLDPTNDEVMHSAPHVLCTSQDMLRSSAAGHLPHSARRAETTNCTSQLEAQLQAAPVEQFQENHDVVGQSDCQVTDDNSS
jgi:hypothetical protein